MKIVYWSGTGNTEKMAELIAKGIEEGGKKAEVINVSEASSDIFDNEETIVLGCPAMGAEVLEECEFEPFIEETADKYSGKKVALFGLGDSSSYSDTFANGMGQLYNAIKDNAEIVGSVSTEGYTFDDSEAVVDGQFVGLAIDDDNEFDQTDSRVDAWVNDLKQYI